MTCKLCSLMPEKKDWSFETVAFWTPYGKNAPFLCIEPWNGSAIRSDEDDDFMHRHHVQIVKSGEKKNYRMEIRIL